MTPTTLLVACAPVLLFLAGLMLLDGYKLVSWRMVVRAFAAGVAAALLALAAHWFLLGMGVPRAVIARALAPVLEESIKAVYIVALIRSDRLGFLVDAGIQGFAVGAGFALIENLYLAEALRDPNPLLWIIRGLGTAVLHGCATAIMAIVSKDLTDRHRSTSWKWYVPGLAVAIAAHALFNLFSPAPFPIMAVMLIGMPLLLFGAFERSEHATREWLGTGLDADAELLELIHSGAISDTRVGHYLKSLKLRFPGPVVGDMLCLLQIHLELALRAKGILIARSAGVDLPIDRDVRANVAEMRFLERSIGPTGRIAMLPVLRRHSRDLWQIHMMKGRA